MAIGVGEEQKVIGSISCDCQSMGAGVLCSPARFQPPIRIVYEYIVSGFIRKQKNVTTVILYHFVAIIDGKTICIQDAPPLHLAVPQSVMPISLFGLS